MKAALAILALVFGGFFVKTLLDPEAQQRIRARSACESVIAGLSANPSNTNISVTHPSLEGDVLIFKWTSDTLQLQNSFGAMIGHAATCGFNTKTGKIDHFNID